MTEENFFQSLADLEGWYDITESGCWEWNRNRYAGGYGRVSVHGMPNMPRKRIRAHRLAWFLVTGEWPPVVRHYVCDNPPCINPEHLRAGTQQDNVDDMVAKGRNFVIPTVPRELHPRTKVSASQILEMRARHKAGGVTYADLGKEYGISRNQARNLVLGVNLVNNV
jgi:hypothetical protein